MHVALIIYGSLATMSGGFYYDRRLVESLRARGDEVTVVSLPWQSYSENLAHNVTHKLAERLHAARPDIIVQDELNHPSLFRQNRALRGIAPIVSIVHHLRSSEPRPPWRNAFYRRVERKYLRSVDAYLFNSETTREVVATLVIDQRPSTIATPGGDRLPGRPPPAYIATRARSGPLRLLFAGSVTPRKGLHVLVEAMARARPNDWRLVVAGDTAGDRAYAARIRRQIEQAGLADRVWLAGHLADDSLSAAMRDSHLLVVPSAYEGFGIAYLEGMGFGLPAIATTAGAAGETIVDDYNGYLIAPGDSVALAQRLQLLDADRRRLAAMSRAAVETFRQRPSWDESMEHARAFLKEIAG